jgi:uncharacterized damage-inducible protein DinB
METIQSLFKHLHWANLRILDTLQSAEVENKHASNLFSHILHAENVRVTRLNGIESGSLPIWADISLESCVELVKQNHQQYAALLSSNLELDQSITYKNSKDTEFCHSVREILTHVALHGQYHRGQINQQLRLAGYEPINVDYITFRR